ncbi:hypothetical protein MPSEU_000261000 [Mayamaea pseudoterrestris]|nr:hypothetical protein MPSEU_000261000 [Mayamaea pseudoterrestris]
MNSPRHADDQASLQQQNPFDAATSNFSSPSLSKSYRESLEHLVDFDVGNENGKQPTARLNLINTTNNSVTDTASSSSVKANIPQQQQRTKLNPDRANFAAMLNQQRMQQQQCMNGSNGSASVTRLQQHSLTSNKHLSNDAPRQKLSAPSDLTTKLNAMFTSQQMQAPLKEQQQQAPRQAPRQAPATVKQKTASSSKALLSPDDLPTIARFRRMLQMKVPQGAVRNQVFAEGYDEVMVNAVFSKQPLNEILMHLQTTNSESVMTNSQGANGHANVVGQEADAMAESTSQSPDQQAPRPLPKHRQHQQHSNGSRKQLSLQDPSPQQFLTAAVLTNALQDNKQFQQMRQVNVDESEAMPIKSLSMHMFNQKVKAKDGDADNDNESLSTMGSIEAGPKSKEWRQSQLNHAQRIKHVYESTQQTARIVDAHNNLPHTQYKRDMQETKERQKQSASLLMEHMVGESTLFHKQVQQMEQQAQTQEQQKQRRVSFTKELEPKRMVELKSSKGSSEQEEKREIEPPRGSSEPFAAGAASLPIETPLSTPKLKESAKTKPEDEEPSGIMIGLSVAASNARQRRSEKKSSVFATSAPSMLRTNVPVEESSTPPPTASVNALSTEPPSSAPPTFAPTLQPTTSSRRQALLEVLVPVSLDNGTSLQTPGSPQYKALDWSLTNNNIDDNTARVVQRYALATLYYSTNSLADNSRSWLNTSGWLSSDDECTWYGVKCVGKALTSLQLTSNQLIGTLPDELSVLNKLQTLSLNNNALQSTIPTAIGLLTSLTDLDLSSNSLSGTLASEIANLSNLSNLLLQANLLEGGIPDDFGQLLQLQQIRLDSNNLNGNVPEAVCYAFSASQPRFYSDCAGSNPEILCPAYPCCTYCCQGGSCDCVYAGTGFDFLC